MVERTLIVRRFPLLSELTKDGVKVSGGGVQRMARCPFHKDRAPSLSVNVDKQTWYCHAGCGGGSVIDYIARRDGKSIEIVLAELGARIGNTAGVASSLSKVVTKTSMVVDSLRKTIAQPLSTPLVGNGEKLGTLVCSYNYEGPTGKVLYRVNRYDPKSFRQQHLVGDRWVWGMEGVERVLYHLPEVLASGDKAVWLVEGEKDADNLRALGAIATSNVGGAKSWMDAYAEMLAGRDVVLCGDRDAVGLEATERKMECLDGKARRLRVITFPASFKGKDISDYLEEFGSTESQKNAVNDLLERASIIVQGSTLGISSMADLEREYVDFLRRSNEVSYSFKDWLPTFGFRLRPSVPGDVISFVASTGAGKTAALQNIALTSGLPTLLFQMELSSVISFERFISLAMKMTQSEVEDAYRKEPMPDWRRTGKLDNVFVCNQSGLTVNSIETLVKRAELKMPRPVLVLIDYVQLCNGMGKSRYEQMTNVASDLKSMAKNCGVILVLASQVMRKPGDNREIGLQDAKDSGSIENSSSLLFGMWRDEDDATLMWMKVAKNTRGYSGSKLACNFDGARMLITERTPQP